jgi:methionyl-tRNA formyltransferase
VLLIGEEAAGARILKALAGSRHRIAAVMSSDKQDRGNTSLAAAAQARGYLTWPAKLVKDPAFADQIRTADVDIILNIHSLYIVHERVLRAARIGAFNLHPGPLPEYAGLNTVSWAIYNGESSYGVTLHWMEPEIDAGDIVYRSDFPIEETDTPIRLMHKCVESGVPLALALLDAAAENAAAIPRIRQDLSRRRYFGRRAPEGGALSWSRRAVEVVNFVRACDYAPFPSPWGHPSATLGNHRVELVRVARTHEPCAAAPGTVGYCDEAKVMVAASDEWVAVQRVRLDGRVVRPLEVLGEAAGASNRK